MKAMSLPNHHMMFFDRALDAQRTQLMTAMADAVSECRAAADQAAVLNQGGEAGLMRLVEIWGALQAGVTYLEGYPTQILADVLAQIYAHLTRRNLNDPVGMALYVELNYMMAALMLGEWYE